MHYRQIRILGKVLSALTRTGTIIWIIKLIKKQRKKKNKGLKAAA